MALLPIARELAGIEKPLTAKPSHKILSFSLYLWYYQSPVHTKQKLPISQHVNHLYVQHLISQIMPVPISLFASYSHVLYTTELIGPEQQIMTVKRNWIAKPVKHLFVRCSVMSSGSLWGSIISAIKIWALLFRLIELVRVKLPKFLEILWEAG